MPFSRISSHLRCLPRRVSGMRASAMQHSSKHNLTQLQQHQIAWRQKTTKCLLFSSANLLRFLSETNDAQLRICWGCQTRAFPSETLVQAHILTSHNAQHNITHVTHTHTHMQRTHDCLYKGTCRTCPDGPDLCGVESPCEGWCRRR